MLNSFIRLTQPFTQEIQNNEPKSAELKFVHQNSANLSDASPMSATDSGFDQDESSSIRLKDNSSPQAASNKVNTEEEKGNSTSVRDCQEEDQRDSP